VSAVTPPVVDDDPAARRVSLAIPLYQPNRIFLAQTISSIRKQTRPPDEIVFTDDSDPTVRRWVRNLAEGLPFRFVENTERLGMVPNWNASVQATTGTHVVVAHQDDVLEPEALGHMLGVFDLRPKIAICAVGQIAIDEHGRPRRWPVRANHRDRLFVSPRVHDLDYHEMTYLMLRHGQIFGPPTAMMFRRSYFDEVGGFDPSYAQSVDIDFALRMTRASSAAYLSLPLIKYRYHDANATGTNVASGRTLEDRDRLYREHCETQDFDPESRRRMRANLVLRAAYDGMRAAFHGRWGVVGAAIDQMYYYRVPPRVVARRMGEVAMFRNDDAR
jgi:GT2 family glycosyltransferase